jgi:hypothetical protein
MLTRRVCGRVCGLVCGLGGSVLALALACTPSTGAGGPAGTPVATEPVSTGGAGKTEPDAMAASGGHAGNGASMAGGSGVGEANPPGTAGSSGAAGNAGEARPDASDADAGAAVDASAPIGADGPSATAFTCNLVLGIKQTGEWFAAGFETVVENARWEVVPIHDGHIELWADPMNAIWGQKTLSPCTQGAATPDRVIFVGTNYDYTTTAEFVPKYLAVIENIKAKFASVKRIELMTHVRAPGNVACPGALDFKTTIKPAQDQSIEMAISKYPGLVFAAPKFEVDSCADYGLYPHFKGGGAAAVAKKIGAYYQGH